MGNWGQRSKRIGQPPTINIQFRLWIDIADQQCNITMVVYSNPGWVRPMSVKLVSNLPRQVLQNSVMRAVPSPPRRRTRMGQTKINPLPYHEFARPRSALCNKKLSGWNLTSLTPPQSNKWNWKPDQGHWSSCSELTCKSLDLKTADDWCQRRLISVEGSCKGRRKQRDVRLAFLRKWPDEIQRDINYAIDHFSPAIHDGAAVWLGWVTSGLASPFIPQSYSEHSTCVWLSAKQKWSGY